MLITLIPLFDANMTVCAYSLFTQKKNFLLNPSLLGTGQNDGAVSVHGLEIVQNMGMETLSDAGLVFVSISNISIFSDISSQCNVPHNQLVLLIDNTCPPVSMYIDRLRELKEAGYGLAIRKLPVSSFLDYSEILNLMDYILLDSEKIEIPKACTYFSKVHPKLKICAGNIQTTDSFEQLRDAGGCTLYEGSFYRIPVTRGANEVAPLKFNYIELLNLVNSEDFDLSQAADIIGRDTALVISLLQMVNKMSINSEITSIRHAAAMLGQRELKKWINTAVVQELCQDRPNEIIRLSLLRAKFAENLAPLFEMGQKAQELFLMGLFSVLDIILEKPLEEALSLVTVSHSIHEALTSDSGELAPVLDFVTGYEKAHWQNVSRIMLLKNIDIQAVYDAYMDALRWYRKLVQML